ncbi:MAG: class I SAM-dependent methyltransferase [Limisphaerales bacterium]
MNQFPWRLRVAWKLINSLTPWLRSSQEHYFEKLELLIQRPSKILDIGCGKEFLMSWLRPELFQRLNTAFHERGIIFGVDPYLPSLQQNPSRLTACALADHLPFSDGSFDIVTANMVAEHVAEPIVVLREVFRVLRPNGLFVFHTPNLRAPAVGILNVLPHALKKAVVPFFEGGRQSEDVFPTHYRLNKRDAIEHAASQSGLSVDSISYVFTSPMTQMLGPFVIVELLLTRFFSGARFASFRPDLICVLRKPESPSA